MGSYWEDLGQSEVKGNYRIVSGDGHVAEPPDLWTTRIDPKFKDRAPRVERMEEADMWVCGDTVITGVAGHTHAGRRFTDLEGMNQSPGRWEDVRRGGYDPDEAVKDMDTDGVDIDVVFPSPGNACYRVPDSELLTAIAKAYNDWLSEFCSAYPKRLKGVAMTNPDDIPTAIKEMERARKLGLVAAMIPVKPLPDMPYDSPVYEPLWAAAQDLQMPLCCHTGTTRTPPQPSGVKSVAAPGAPGQMLGSSRLGSIDSAAFFRDSASAMIFSNVFERYPKLQIGCMEMGTGWIPFFVRTLDRGYVMNAGGPIDRRKFKSGALPSDFVHRNMFFGFQDDELGIRMRDIVGVDNLVFSSDYPHRDGTWPRSRQMLEELMVGCSDQEKAKMAGENAVRIYDLD